MGHSRKASYEMVQDVIKATNRYMYNCPGTVLMGEDEVRFTFPEEEHEDILGEVEQLLELIEEADAHLEVRWGYDDERAWPKLPTSTTVHEDYVKGDWRIHRTDDAIYVSPINDASAGPVIFWWQPIPMVDTSFPQPHGYVDQD